MGSGVKPTVFTACGKNLITEEKGLRFEHPKRKNYLVVLGHAPRSGAPTSLSTTYFCGEY